MGIIKCALHYYMGDLTRLLMSANHNTDVDDLAFIWCTFHVVHYFAGDFTKLLVSASGNPAVDNLFEVTSNR